MALSSVDRAGGDIGTFGSTSRTVRPEEGLETGALEYVFEPSQVQHPLISVVVTSFNYAAYIDACLASIAAQSYRQFECVVVDDGSTDESVAVIERFIERTAAARKFRLIRHAKNEGQMAAFQTGLQQTRGSFIVFVDADDLLFPDFLETHLTAHLNSARPAAFTNSELLQIAADGQVLSGIQALAGTPELRAERPSDGNRWRFSAPDGLTFQQTALPLKYFGPWEVNATGWIWSTTSAAMFRRSVLDVIMCTDARCLRISADRYIFNFSHALGGSLLIRTVHGCYRRHGTNGFSGNPVIGGDAFVGDIRRDPAHLASTLIFQHLLEHYDRFCGLIGRSSTIGLLRMFGPVTRRAKVRLALKIWYRMWRAGKPLKGTPAPQHGTPPLTAVHATSAIDEGE